MFQSFMREFVFKLSMRTIETLYNKIILANKLILYKQNQMHHLKLIVVCVVLSSARWLDITEEWHAAWMVYFSATKMNPCTNTAAKCNAGIQMNMALSVD